ncbi:hypothetical protein PO909_018985 [Leuciscus waleckii]
MEEFSQNGGPERGEEKMCSASGIWGLEAAEVMSLEQRIWEKNKSLSLFRSSLQSQQGWGWGGGGGRIGRGCWEMVKDAKPALQPTLVAHIFVL